MIKFHILQWRKTQCNISRRNFNIFITFQIHCSYHNRKYLHSCRMIRQLISFQHDLVSYFIYASNEWNTIVFFAFCRLIILFWNTIYVILLFHEISLSFYIFWDLYGIMYCNLRLCFVSNIFSLFFSQPTHLLHHHFSRH